MAAFYNTFTIDGDFPQNPDMSVLNRALKNTDATMGAILISPAQVKIKKSTSWSGGDISTVQNILNNYQVQTEVQTAQFQIEDWSLRNKATFLALVDMINEVRALLDPPLSPISDQDAVEAVVDKIEEIG